MLSRPKPGESEEDLLKFQSQFLAARAQSAAQVVKKADKRKGGTGSSDQDKRDVVDLEEFPDLPPALAPAPPKKSKFKSGSVRFADADPETILDQHDRHITAVFSKIIERDTSMMAVTAPLSSGDAFPRAFHRSQFKSQERPVFEKRSIFAQQIAARKAEEAGAVSPSKTTTSVPTAGLGAQGASMAGPHIITGEGLRGAGNEEEAHRIHQENVERLRSLSQEEIRLEQERLLGQLDPSLISFLKAQHLRGERRGNVELPGLRKDEVPVCSREELQSAVSMHSHEQEPGMEASTLTEELVKEEGMESSSKEDRGELARENDLESSTDKEKTKDEEECMELAAGDLPVKPQKDWVHMDKVELEKLEWTKDLPQARQKRTKKGLQARFSLKGEIIPPDADFPTHLGLHHHGEEAERAGYSLQELFHLSRSQVIQQRALALNVLRRIVLKAKNGEFSMSLKGSVLRLLLDAGFLFLLRFSLDDPAENVIAESVHALCALLVSPEDEEYLDMTFSWYQGAMVFPFIPNNEEEDEDEDDKDEEPIKNAKDEKERKKEKEEQKPDPDVARYDVIKGLLKTKILHRLRYILEVVRPASSVVVDVLRILTRVARHSTEVCSQVLDCPRLMETVIQNFLPAQWSCPNYRDGQLLTSIYGIPCAAAMKLFRVLASAGRNLSARLLNKFELKARLGRFVAEDPQDLPLQQEEAVRLSMEAFQFWAVTAGYGQACDLYRDLYPVLVKNLQSLSRLVADCRGVRPSAPLLVQRAAAIVTLLTNVTQTAACAAELQQQLESSPPDDGPQIPPPPLTWIHVSGLKPFLEACLKRSLEEISHPSSWDTLRPLTATYLVYLGVYYRACSRQPSLNPVEYVEDAERLTSEVLLPLLGQSAVRGMWELLRPCSAVCNKLSCSPAPESVASIVSLSCTGGKPPMNVAGSKSPFPFLTSLLFLINSLASIHKGLVSKFSFILECKELNNYLKQSWTSPSPGVTHCSAWILHHEYHLQYFVLSLAQKVAVACPEHPQHASLYHCAAMMLLGRLLPGSEHLAHQLLLSSIFNSESFPEGKMGGPEAADLSDILHIQGARPTQPGSAASVSPNLSRGALLKEAYQQLPSIRACYLTHFANLELALCRSQASYKGQTHLVQSMLLPEVKGPSLPSDWPFLPLILLYNKVANAETRGAVLNSLPPDLVNTVTQNLQWVLLLETWRVGVLHDIPAAAKLARLACIFLTGGDLFLEGPVHCYTAALLSLYCQPKALDALQLDVPLPGLFSFYDLYVNLLEQFEAVSFGDPLFGAFVLIPLQRQFSVHLRRTVFGEHVSTLRSLGIPLKECPIPLERYTSPPEDCLDLLRLYFRTLMTGVLRQSWCPILYVVAVAHLNSFIFSQEAVAEEVDIARKSMLRKTWCLTDEVLKKHLIYFKRPHIELPLGFELFEQLPPLRQRYLEKVTRMKAHALCKELTETVPSETT